MKTLRGRRFLARADCAIEQHWALGTRAAVLKLCERGRRRRTRGRARPIARRAHRRGEVDQPKRASSSSARRPSARFKRWGEG
jgi:hypothetical protein